MTHLPTTNIPKEGDWLTEILFGLAADTLMASQLRTGDTGVDKARAAIQAELAELERKARLDEIQQTICHKHGFSTSCPWLLKRMAALTPLTTSSGEASEDGLDCPAHGAGCTTVHMPQQNYGVSGSGEAGS